MKHDILRYLVITVFCTALCCSCDLNEHATSFVSPGEYYQTLGQCEAAVNGCYIDMKSIFNVNYFATVECVTDVLSVGINNDNARLKISPSNPGEGTNTWLYCYRSIMRCNATIAGLESAPSIADADRKKLLAETKVVRSFYYWILTCFFGDVPFYTEDVNNMETMEKIATLGRTPADEIRKSLIKELQECIPDLPQVRFSDEGTNHMGAAAGWLILAKMCQWNKDWDAAIKALSHLEAMYGSLSDYDLSDIWFRKKNTPESIFEIQRTYTAGGLSVTTSVACICTPTHGKDYLYDGVEILELGNTATTWTCMRPTDYMCQSLMTKKGTDLRTKMNMAWDYNGIAFASAASRPWAGPKFWCPDMQQAADYNNNRLFRYADAVLMLAECYAEQDDYATSVGYLNQVRERANLTDYTYKTKALLLEEIQKERARELFGEWQRKYDLVRWGIWYDVTRDNTGRAEVRDNIMPCHEFYPIPDTQVTYSKGALDNKEYEKYGL